MTSELEARAELMAMTESEVAPKVVMFVRFCISRSR